MHMSRNPTCLTPVQQGETPIAKEHSCIIGSGSAFGFRVECQQPPPQLSISLGTNRHSQRSNLITY